MDKQTKVKCGCGQVTCLVERDGKLLYDQKKHGNGEDSKGKCFNCFAPLKSKELDDYIARQKAELAAAEAAAEKQRKIEAEKASKEAEKKTVKK